VLTRISNQPRDYAWGSTTLIADLQGRAPSGAPEAEVWFGDHPGSPAAVHDGSGRTLDEWLPAESDSPRLPYLLKLLAAGAPLSIQAHPSKAQAEEGFAREEAEGVARDAASRNYKDDNHKPELIVALSERFEALAGLRDLAATTRLLEALGDSPAVTALRGRLASADAAEALRTTIGWLLSPDAASEVEAIIAAAVAARSEEFAAELALAGRLADAYPGDAGVVVALLMNLVSLGRGEAIFVPAGVLHAYVAGLGVELMAASDNVLRGGLTPKHIDVDELLGLLDTTPSPPPLLSPTAFGDGAEIFDAGVPDFALVSVRMDAATSAVPLWGTSIVLAVAGEVHVAGVRGAEVTLAPGEALLATADEGTLALSGPGEAFVAMPGRV
jgi:mannose-6-phosphate isomerase